MPGAPNAPLLTVALPAPGRQPNAPRPVARVRAEPARIRPCIAQPLRPMRPGPPRLTRRAPQYTLPRMPPGRAAAVAGRLLMAAVHRTVAVRPMAVARLTVAAAAASITKHQFV